MLFWLCMLLMLVGFLVFSIGSIIWDEKHKILNFLSIKYETVLTTLGGILMLLFGSILIIMLIFICDKHMGANAELEKYRQTYKAITYKVESGVCRDEFGHLNKEVMDEVQTWNEDISYNKSLQRDFWVGIFHPNIYDEFEVIDYKKISHKK